MTQPALQTPSTETENTGGRVVLLLILGLVVLFGGGYLAACLVAGDKVPRGTTVAGVDVGGQSPSEAALTLEEGLAELQTRPIRLHIGEESRVVAPEEAGLAVDYEATVAEAGGRRSFAPSRVWDYFTGGDELPAVVTVDEGRMTAVVDDLAAESGRPPVEGDIRFADGKATVVEARAGEGIEPEAARTALEAAYLSDERDVTLELVPQEPEIDAADVQEALDGFANPAVSGPVILRFQNEPVRIEPEDYSGVLSMKPEDGELVPVLHEKKLKVIVDEALGDDGAPVDATVRLVGGTPTVIPDKPGVVYDLKDISKSFLATVVKQPGQREIEVPAAVARAKFTTEEAEKLRIVERVSTFTTYFPYAEYRNTNIGRAAELISGTVLKPGETFSLNDTVGERTEANGFTKGYIISDGIFKQDLGGGVSQVATTTFNAMFFAGLKDVEHKPHSFYIDRYPEGREATVAWGAVDLRFTNDTPYGVLIDAAVRPSTPSSQGVVTVTMYSTKYWDITSTTSKRYNFTKPGTRTLTTPDCEPNEGYGGFDVDVTRYFRRAGESELHHREIFNTTYIPSDTVICKDPEPSPSPSPSPAGQD